MSRKYMLDRWCVRCGRKTATPYIRNNTELLSPKMSGRQYCIDLGCGNGRNIGLMKELGYDVLAFDMAGDVGTAITLGKQKLPVQNRQANVVLANYVFMFLSPAERSQVVKEINRITSATSMVVVELYPAKDSYTKTDKEVTELRDELLAAMNDSKNEWATIRRSKDRFIAQKRFTPSKPK